MYMHINAPTCYTINSREACGLQSIILDTCCQYSNFLPTTNNHFNITKYHDIQVCYDKVLFRDVKNAAIPQQIL